MPELVSDASVIDLGVLGGDRPALDGPQPPHLRRLVRAGVLAVVCLLAFSASARARPALGEPLWTGSVSLNGFSLGTRSLYVARPDGTAVSALDLFTGQPRWSRDITELPDSTTDLGNGVTAVVTRRLVGGGGLHEVIITLVRDATGEPIGQTTGESYLPGPDGHVLLVFSSRTRGPDRCAAPESVCMDVTAWDIGTAAVAWRIHLPPNTGVLPSVVDGRVEALAALDAAGNVALVDLSSGTVTATTKLSPELFYTGGQVALLRDALLTAGRGPEGITVTAYRRPALDRSWSVVVPDATPMDDQGGGHLFVSDCGRDACLTVNRSGTHVIDPSTGTVMAPIAAEVIKRLGDGVFLAGPRTPDGEPSTGGNGLVVAPDGRTVAQLGVTAAVDWADSGDRGLVTQEGQQRTGFVAIDRRGALRYLGSVPGVGLTCHARAAILACSDPSGGLRVWRLPV